MTDWLILIAFGVAWLAGWCSRWQWDKTREEPEEMPFNRWHRDLYGEPNPPKLVDEPPILAKPGQVHKMLGRHESFDRWAKDLPR